MELKYSDITEKIIGCAMKVHSRMGSGFPEIIYSRCLAIEFNSIGLKYEKEKSLNVFYNNIIVGSRRVDFMVEEKIIVELKTHVELTNTDIAQTLNYLESHRQEIALLLNFGAKSLQFKRIINNKTLVKRSNSNNILEEPITGYYPDNLLSNPSNPWS